MLHFDRHKLAKRRAKLGLTQDQLAERAYCKTLAYGAWEAGVETPSKWWLKRLADALRCGIRDLQSTQQELNERPTRAATHRRL